jgi:hypothetical protein
MRQQIYAVRTALFSATKKDGRAFSPSSVTPFTPELQQVLNSLRAKYPYVDLEGLTPLQQEAVVQHYSSGTKLLDFTSSIYIAAFFATSGPRATLKSSESPSVGAIYRMAPAEMPGIEG